MATSADARARPPAARSRVPTQKPLIAFVLCVGAAIYVLLPHKLVFAFRGQALLAVSDHEGIDDVTEAYRALGIWIEPMLESNRDTIADLSDLFTISCALLTAEVILWTISLAG
jgi:hypothetical protein